MCGEDEGEKRRREKKERMKSEWGMKGGMYMLAFLFSVRGRKGEKNEREQRSVNGE